MNHLVTQCMKFMIPETECNSHISESSYSGLRLKMAGLRSHLPVFLKITSPRNSPNPLGDVPASSLTMPKRPQCRRVPIPATLDPNSPEFTPNFQPRRTLETEPRRVSERDHVTTCKLRIRIRLEHVLRCKESHGEFCKSVYEAQPHNKPFHCNGFHSAFIFRRMEK